MGALAFLWKRHRAAVLLFAAALALCLFFAIRFALFWIYWNDPAHRDQTIEGWMTPGYVAVSWDVPHDVVAEAVAWERGDGRPPRLAEIAAERGIPLADLAARIEAAILTHRATHP